MNEAAFLTLILASPLVIPAMVWFCMCVEVAELLGRPLFHSYVYLAGQEQVTSTVLDAYRISILRGRP